MLKFCGYKTYIWWFYQFKKEVSKKYKFQNNWSLEMALDNYFDNIGHKLFYNPTQSGWVEKLYQDFFGLEKYNIYFFPRHTQKYEADFLLK